MGLDLFEIMLEAEKQFDVHLAKADFTSRFERRRAASDGRNTLLVSDLVELICTAIEQKDRKGEHPLRAAACDRVVATVAYVTGRPASDIDESTALADVFPIHTRRDDWNRLSEKLGRVDLPPLEASPIWGRLLPLLLIVAVLASIFLSLPLGGLTAIATCIALPAAAFVAIHYFAQMLRRRGRHFPASMRTVAQLTDHEFAHVLASETRDHSRELQDEVMDGIRAVLVAVLGVTPEQVRPNACLLRDLGAE